MPVGKYKKNEPYLITKDKIIYPLRPLLSVCVGLFFAGLYLAGLLTLSSAIYFGAIFTLDDIIFMPVMRVCKSARNYRHSRKLAKAWISIIGIFLGMIAGGVLGFLMVAKLATVLTLVPLVTGALGSSLVFFLMACVICYKLVSHFNEWAEHSTSSLNETDYKKLSRSQRFKEMLMDALRTLGRNCPDFVGIMIGARLAEYLPIVGGTVGMTIDVVIVSALLGAFVMAILTKWMTQAFYKLRYGHSNWDGYDGAVVEKQVSTVEKDKSITSTINKVASSTNNVPVVKVEQVTKLRQLLIQMIRIIKNESTLLEDLWGVRAVKSAVFKDALHAMLTLPKGSDQYTKEHLHQPEDRIANFREILYLLNNNPMSDVEMPIKKASPQSKSKLHSAQDKIAKKLDHLRADFMSIFGLGTYARHVGRITQDHEEGSNDMRLKFHSRAEAGMKLGSPIDKIHLEQACRPFL